MRTLTLKILAVTLFMASVIANAQPKSDAEFILLNKAYKINPDGSYEVRCVKQLKLHTHLAFNSLYGETFIVYNPKYQDLSFNHCYTIQADGKKVEAPSNAFNEVLPAFAADAPYYNHLREMVVTHTGLELGATIYLDYTLRTKAGYTSGLMANDELQEMSPINQYVISVEYPSNATLVYNQYNCSKPETSATNGTTKLVWTLKNIPARSLEVFQPSDHRQAPRVAFTTLTGDKLIDLINNQFTSANATIEKKVTDLIANISDETEKTKAITNFVINNIATVNIPLIYNAYKLRPVNEVYSSAYGTPIEKTALLTAMLKAAGIKATPVATTPEWTGEGAMAGYNYAIEGFWLEGANEFPVLLGYSPSNYKYVSPLRLEPIMWNDQGKVCYTISSYTEPISTIMNNVDINYTYTISSNLKNDAEPKFEMTKSGTVDVKTTTNSNINIKSEKQTEAQPLTSNSNNGYYTINLPTSELGVDAWHMNMLSAEPRTTLFEIPQPINESYTYTCVLPNNMKVLNKQTDISINNAAGKVIITITPNNNSVTVKRSITLNNKITEPKNYMALKELMDVWSTSNYRIIVVK